MSVLFKTSRALILCAPLLALGACAESRAQATADQALATADQALATANQALSASQECSRYCEGNFNRGLRK